MNLHYSSEGLADFYATQRMSYEDFYPSERWALELLDLQKTSSILDIGSACGGLGKALHDRFGCTEYVGLEIHDKAARIGNEVVASFGGRVLCGDILDAEQILQAAGIAPAFDTVVSFSALDWNLDVLRNVQSAWSHVKPGGVLVMSLRLHPRLCLLDLATSYQSTTPGQAESDEIAPYVIINLQSAIGEAAALDPECVQVLGFWGDPSVTAVTPVERIVFCLAVLRKRQEAGPPTQWIVDFPKDVRPEFDVTLSAL